MNALYFIFFIIYIQYYASRALIVSGQSHLTSQNENIRTEMVQCSVWTRVGQQCLKPENICCMDIEQV